MKNIKIGLFGFGVVGEALYRILSEKDCGFEISQIVVSSPSKKRSIAQEHFSYHRDTILLDESLDIIVELTNDTEEAYRIISSALRASKKVVTAGKKVVAANLEEFIHLQKEFGGTLLYEAAVCGGIPLIRTLEDHFRSEEILSLDGICNGSSNYILSGISKGRGNFNEVLLEAQLAGFAETDPSLDIDGLDSANKLSIIAAHAFGLLIRPEAIPTVGITALGNAAFAEARKNNHEIKLLNKLWRNKDGSIATIVIPALLELADPLSKVSDEYNGVSVSGKHLGTQFFSGRGAGGNPTAAAVVSDLHAITKDYRYSYSKVAPYQHSSDDEKISIYTTKSFAEELKLIYSFHEDDFVRVEIKLTDLLRQSERIRKESIPVLLAPVKEKSGISKPAKAFELLTY